MRSIGWYVVGYFGMGVLVWVIGAIALVIAAAVSDYKWDSENDPSIDRTDTLNALSDAGDDAVGTFDDLCNAEDNPRAAKVRYWFLAWIKWPYTVPQAYSILWKRAVELRNQKR